jgi:hypothetical protein
MRALRYDVFRLDGIQRTPQGGIRLPATLTRTGVFEYRRADGSVSRELRHPDDVFHADAIESFANAPLTVGHVPAVNPDNWGAVAVGHVVGTPKRDGTFLAAECSINRRDAIQQVEGGKLKELSCGYEVELDPTSGEYEGQKYDAIQRKIQGNHVALLPEGWGRAGPDVKLRTDSQDHFPGGMAWRLDAGVPREPYPVVVSTTPVTPPAAVVPPAAPAADALLGRIDSLTAANAELQKKVDGLPAQTEAAAAARAALLSRVTPLMPKGAKDQAWRADGKTDGQIVREALIVLRPEIRLDGKSDDYVTGAFEEALRSVETSRANAGAIQMPLHPGLRRDESGDLDVMEQKNQAAKKKSQDAWKTPIKGALTRDGVRR